MRIWPNEGEWPRVEDLGPATQKRDLTLPKDTFVDHCGGLTFAGDGQLYYVASRWRDPVYNPDAGATSEREGVVWRLNPATLQREEVARLEHPTQGPRSTSRAARWITTATCSSATSARGPSGIFKVQLPADRKKKNAHLPIRMWG